MVGLASKAREDKVLLGIVLTLSAYAGFSCIDSSAKWLALAGLPAALDSTWDFSYKRHLASAPR